MYGFRKKCKIDILNVDKMGKPLVPIGLNSFGARKQIKLLSIKKSKVKGKKYTATFLINKRKKVIHFGASGMSDYTKHKDHRRRLRYIKRHRKDLRTNNPARAGYLSMFILWNKKSLSQSIKDYRKRLAGYNKTGKFKIN
jgi:hypothetical protein